MREREDDSDADEYVRRASFDAGVVDEWAVTEGRVALLADGTVYLVGEDRDQIAVDESARDVALNGKLFVLGDETVTAYSVSGTRLWSETVPDARSVAALDGSDFVVVLDSDDRLLGLDAAAGHERFAHDRPDADVAATPALVATDDALVVAAWSFISVLAPTGERRLRTTLDGAVNDVGVVDDTVVCVMKDERLVGLDVESGDERWCHEWSVDRVAPFARDELLVQTDTGVQAVSADGEWTVPDFDDGVPVAASEGTPVCVLVDSLVNVYARTDASGGDVSADVLVDEVEPSDGSLPVAVENTGEAPTVATVSVSVDGATVAFGSEQRTLVPGERERMRVGLTDVTGEEVAVEVAVDGDTATSATLPVVDDVGALDVSASLAAVRPDGVTAEVAVTNDSGTPVRGLSLSPGEASRGELPPGDTWTATVPLPSDGEIGVTTDDDETRVGVPTPVEPLSADVRCTDGLVVVVVENTTGARVEDTVTVDSELLPQEFAAEFEGGPGSTLYVASPPVRGGEAAVTVDGGLVSYAESVSVPTEAVVGRQTDRQSTAAQAARSRQSASAGAGQDTGAATGAGGSEAADAENGGDGDDFPLELDRRLDAAEPTVGGLEFEHVDVTNGAAEPRRVSVRSEDGPDASTVVDPDATCTFARAHTFTSGEITVPGLAVETEDGTRHSDAVDATVESGDVYCLATLAPTPNGQRLHLEVVNGGASAVTVDGVSVRSFEVETADAAVEAPAHDTGTATVPVSGPPLADVDEPALVTFTVTHGDGTSSDGQTLAYAPPVEELGLAHLAVAVDDETVLDDDSGTVVVRLENAGEAPVEGLTVEAAGDQLRTMLYDALTVEELAPGDTTKHYVDVTGVDGGVDVPVTLAAGDDDRTETVHVAGSEPAAAAVGVDRPELPSPADVALPDRISTPFSVEPDDDGGARTE